MLSKASLVRELKKWASPFLKGQRSQTLSIVLSIGSVQRVGYFASQSQLPTPNNPVTLIDNRDAIWLPDSRMARMIVDSKLVFVLDRCAEPPNDVPTLDVPKDFNTRWPEEQAPIESEWTVKKNDGHNRQHP